MSTLHMYPHFPTQALEMKREVVAFGEKHGGTAYIDAGNPQRKLESSEEIQELLKSFTTAITASAKLLVLQKAQLTEMGSTHVPIDPEPKIRSTIGSKRAHYLDRCKKSRRKDFFRDRVRILNTFESLVIGFFEKHAIFKVDLLSDEYVEFWHKQVPTLMRDRIYDAQPQGMSRLQDLCFQALCSRRDFSVSLLLKKGFRTVQYPVQGDLAVYFNGVRPLIGTVNENCYVESDWGDRQVRVHQIFSLPIEFGEAVVFLRRSSSTLFPGIEQEREASS